MKRQAVDFNNIDDLLRWMREILRLLNRFTVFGSSLLPVVVIVFSSKLIIPSLEEEGYYQIAYGLKAIYPILTNSLLWLLLIGFAYFAYIVKQKEIPFDNFARKKFKDLSPSDGAIIDKEEGKVTSKVNADIAIQKISVVSIILNSIRYLFIGGFAGGTFAISVSEASEALYIGAGIGAILGIIFGTGEKYLSQVAESED